MKKFRLVLVAMLALCTVALTGCTKDDATEEDNTENNGGSNGGNNATGLENMQITETANQIIATWTIGDAGYTLSYKYIFDFDAEGLCTKATLETTFPTADLAAMALREAQANSEYEASLRGKTLVLVYTEYTGNTKEEIRMALEIMKNGYNG